MPTLRNCVKCGEHIVAGDRFCPHCGTEQPPTLGGELLEAQTSRWEDIEDRLRVATEGRYHIRGVIGRGGMAAVYLADWPQMELRVAIKVMDPYLLDKESFVLRFRQEARTIARLKHRHIIRVYDSGQFGDLHYFCMDYSPGRSLEKVLAEVGPLPVSVARLWISQAADALAYAHQQPKPIVHRDVKPSNILLDNEGDLVLTDFGIAKVRDVDRTQSSPSLTMPGVVLGTPVYLSPEQASLILNPHKAPSGGEVTGASDQYALGVVAYEMLVGNPPFSGDLSSLLTAHVGEEPPQIMEKRPDCPPDLADLVMRMLAKTPSDRWPSMGHVHAKLSAHSPPPGSPLRTQLAGYAKGYKPVSPHSITVVPDGVFQGARLWPRASRQSEAVVLGSREASTKIGFVGSPGDHASGPDTPWSEWLREGSTSRAKAGTGSRVEEDVALPRNRRRRSRTLYIGGIGGVTVVMVLLLLSRLGIPQGKEVLADGTTNGPEEREMAPVAQVASVTISGNRNALSVGETVRLEAIVKDVDERVLAEHPVEWSINDWDLATLTDDGHGAVVRAIKPGNAVVSATADRIAGTFQVVVGEIAPVVTAIRLVPDHAELVVGETRQFRVLDQRGENQPGTFHSSDSMVASVSAQGLLRAVRPGLLTVTASHRGLNAEARFRVSETASEEVANLVSKAAVDSIRAKLADVSTHAALANYYQAFLDLDQIGARLANLRARFPDAAVLAELNSEHLESHRLTFARCDMVRRVMMERGERDPPACKAPPTGGSDDLP